jgi:integrase
MVPWNPQRLTQAFDRIRDREHFGWTLHGLRRWNTSDLLDAGEDVTVVAGRQGHRDKATTHKRYAHMKKAADQRAATIIQEGLYQ